MKCSIYSILALGLLSIIVLSEAQETISKDEILDKTHKQVETIKELEEEAKSRKNAIENRNASKLELSFIQNLIRIITDLKHQASESATSLNTSKPLEKEELEDVAVEVGDIDNSIEDVVDHLKEPESRSLFGAFTKSAKMIGKRLTKFSRLTRKGAKQLKNAAKKATSSARAKLTRTAESLEDLNDKIETFKSKYDRKGDKKEMDEEEAEKFVNGLDSSISSSQTVVVIAKNVPGALEESNEGMLLGLSNVRISLGGMGNAYVGRKFGERPAEATKEIFELTKNDDRVEKIENIIDNVANIFTFLGQVTEFLGPQAAPFALAFQAVGAFLSLTKEWLAPAINVVLNVITEAGKAVWNWFSSIGKRSVAEDMRLEHHLFSKRYIGYRYLK